MLVETHQRSRVGEQHGGVEDIRAQGARGYDDYGFGHGYPTGSGTTSDALGGGSVQRGITGAHETARARVIGGWSTFRLVPCLFCAIVAGDEPAHVVLDTEQTLAFLDIRPLFPGHTLLVPKAHYETLVDLPHDLLEPLFAQAQRLAGVMETVLGAAGSFVAMNNRVSQSVAHLHVHVVPRNRKDGLRGFFWPRTKYPSRDDAEAMAQRLRAGLA